MLRVDASEKHLCVSIIKPGVLFTTPSSEQLYVKRQGLEAFPRKIKLPSSTELRLFGVALGTLIARMFSGSLKYLSHGLH